MRRLRRRVLGATLLGGLCLLASAGSGSADDFKVGLRGGYYSKVKDPFVGGELLVPLAHRFYFNPNVEYVFVDNGTYMTFNGDFHYDLPTHSSTYVWLGAGLGALRTDPDGPNNGNTDLVANFLFGIGFRTGSVIPYFQAKVIAKDDSLVSVAFGVRF